MWFVAVLNSGTGNQPKKMVPSRIQLPDYYTATKQLAERRGQMMTSQSNDVIGRRARSCDSSPTTTHRCVRPSASDSSEDGNLFQSFLY